jgi:hypothetical protein
MFSFQALLYPSRDCAANAFELFLLFVAFCVGIASGVQLDHGRTCLGRSLDLLIIGIDKQRHTNIMTRQLVDCGTHFIEVADHIKAALSGHFLPTLRYQTDIVRTDTTGDLYHFFGDR